MVQGDMRSFLIERIWPLLLLIVIVTVIAALVAWTAADVFGYRSLERTVTEALIRIVLVVGIYIFVGNSGVISFGHIGFVCLGAYSTAMLTANVRLKSLNLTGLPDFIRYETYDVVTAAAVGGLTAAVVALLIGIALMRLSGIAASIATFAFLAIVHTVYMNWDSVTGGAGSIARIPRYVDIWVALAWAVVTMIVAWWFQRSKYGLSLKASRENEVAAKASGVNIFRERLIAFTISGFFCGIAGVLYAHYLGTITPTNFYLNMTFIALSMLVVGGINSLSGAVLGVVVITFVIETLRQAERGFTVGAVEYALPSGVQEIALGVIMLLILIFRPGGITANREIYWPFKSREAGGGGGMTRAS